MPDRIDFVFNPVRWKKPIVYVAVMAASGTVEAGETVEFEIRLREYMPLDTFSPALKQQNSIFWDSLEGTDAHATSFKERQATDDHTSKEFTYGEILLPSFIPLLALADPKEGEALFDLGCGSGRPMMVAAMAYPELATCIGIELMPQVYELAQKVKEKFVSLTAER